jgi:hypothetical protein
MSKGAPAGTAFIDIGAVDRTLAEHGSFTVLDWLLAEGLLAYADYSEWRDGHRPALDEALKLTSADVDSLLNEVDRHARALHLAAEPREIFSWSTSNPQALRASKRPEVHRRLIQQWRRATPTPQFDLFMDNAAASAERRLCETLGGLRLDDAARELDHLARLDPSNKSLGDYQDLINYGRHVQTSPGIDAQTLRAEMDGLEQEVQPLVRTLLGADARDYLALAWRRLAQGLSELPPQDTFDDRLHASHALTQIPDWAAARRCLEGEPRLLQQPAWLQGLARACRLTGQPELGLLWWLVCIDRHPQHSTAALEQCDDAVLQKLRSEYLDLEDRLQQDLPEIGFPGFVLLRRPGLSHHLSAVAPLEQPATLLILQLIEARRAGQDEITLRKALGKVDTTLLAMYLAIGGRNAG